MMADLQHTYVCIFLVSRRSDKNTHSCELTTGPLATTHFLARDFDL